MPKRRGRKCNLNQILEILEGLRKVKVGRIAYYPSVTAGMYHDLKTRYIILRDIRRTYFNKICAAKGPRLLLECTVSKPLLTSF